jgi:hypothetical protein
MESEFRTRMNTHSEIIENIVKENINLKDEISKIKEEQEKLQSTSELIHVLISEDPEAQNLLKKNLQRERIKE